MNGRRQGHPYRRARYPAAPSSPSRIGRLRQHLVGRRLHVRRHAAGRARLGHAREVDAGRTPISHKTGCSAAIYLTQPGANTRVRSWTPTAQAQYGFLRHPQRVDLDRRLLHAARRPARSRLPADLPLRLSSLQRLSGAERRNRNVQVAVDFGALAGIEHRGRGLFLDHGRSVDDCAGSERRAAEHRHLDRVGRTEIGRARFVRRRRLRRLQALRPR